MSSKYHQIKKDCLERRRPYEDVDFPANYNSLFGEESENYGNIQWMRPWDIKAANGNPEFIVKGAKYHDITQGNIGNCWYISSVSILATNTLLFEKVVPPNQKFDRSGVFRFNFWIYGEWQEVIIDDRLPTMYGRLFYSRNVSEPNEFWCPLLEKAYAKINRSYFDLHGGFIVNGLVDMTGGISERIILSEPNTRQSNTYTPEQLANILHKCSGMNTLMGSGIYDSSYWHPSITRFRKDLMDEHAYSIIKIAKVVYEYGEATLLHIRDPNANKPLLKEWTGSWCDNSKEWTVVSEEVKREIGYRPEREDGEFWISIEDFMVQFDHVDLVHLTPSAITSELATLSGKREWDVEQYKSTWVKHVSSGGWKNILQNPQIKLVQDKDVGTTVISLLRYSGGDFRMDDDIFVNFFVYKLRPGVDGERLKNLSDAIKIPNPKKFSQLREVTHRFDLEQGVYFIIPATYEQGQEADFILRIFSERKTKTNLVNDRTEKDEPLDDGINMIDTLFHKHAENNKDIDAFILQKIVTDAMPREWGVEDVTLETSRCLLNYFSLDHSGKNIDVEIVTKCWDFVKNCRTAYSMFDVDKSQSIELEEVRSLYRRMGLKFDYKLMAAITRRYGNGGKIYFEDFVQSTTKSLSLHENFTELVKRNPSLDINELMMAAIDS